MVYAQSSLDEYRWAYICLSPTPSSAWSLTPGADRDCEIEEWDLWQVRLEEHDDVRIRPYGGNVIREVRVHNSLPADRLWWVAQREPMCVIEP